jgi:hypothetical protein
MHDPYGTTGVRVIRHFGARRSLAIVVAALTAVTSLSVIHGPAEAVGVTVNASVVYDVAKIGQRCSAGSSGSDTARQCNTPWNPWTPAAQISGSIGNFGQDCDVTFSWHGRLHLKWWNGGDYYSFDTGNADSATYTVAGVWTGSRVVVEDAGGWVQIVDIENCRKPQNGTDFVLVNPALSIASGKLACAKVGSGNLMTAGVGCRYTDQIRLHQDGNAGAPAYWMSAAYGPAGTQWQEDQPSETVRLYGTVWRNSGVSDVLCKGGGLIVEP